MTDALLYGLFGFILFVGLAQAHARFVVRCPPPVPHVLLIWIVGALAVAVGVLASNVTHPITVSVVNLSVYLFAGEIYLFIYAAAVGSLSVRLMVKMLELEPAPDTLQRAIAQYPPTTFFDIRLRSLRAQRLIVEAGGRYRVTAKGLCWARGGVFLKRVLGVGIGG